jgi:hypothetical protein
MNHSAYLVALLSASACLSQASTLVWEDTFTRSSNPLTYDHTTNGTNDYVAAGTSTVTPTLSGNSLLVTDTISGQLAQNVTADQFTAFTLNNGDLVTVSLDVMITSFQATNAASTFRISILDGNTANGTGVFSVGWGYGNVDTSDAGNELFFYSTLSAGITPTPAQAIAWSGGSAAAGFDFGDYNSGTPTSNDTAPIGTSPAATYRISMTFTQGSNSVLGSLTNLGSAQSASFSNTLVAPFNWGNNSSDGLQLLSGLGGFSTYTLDNISVSYIPEPSSAWLCGLLGLRLMRRRR